MAKIKSTIDLGELTTLSNSTVGIAKASVYDGAAEILKACINASKEHDKTGDLSNAWGVHTIIKGDGTVYTDISVDGYDRNGVPNMIKAGSLESGNSKGEKATHCFSKAVKSAKNKAITAMEKAFDDRVKKIVK